MEHTPLTDYTKFPEIKVIDFPSVELAKEAERRWNVHDELVVALERMLEMFGMMVEQVNHAQSVYTGEYIREMNEAPRQAQTALTNATKEGE